MNSLIKKVGSGLCFIIGGDSNPISDPAHVCIFSSNTFVKTQKIFEEARKAQIHGYCGLKACLCHGFHLSLLFLFEHIH